MALDDRDRNFEKALAQHLRPAASAETLANSKTNSATPAPDCPDSEILAAYHERSLSPDELISWKSHIAGCSRCQQLLAHLELTDAIPVASEPVGAPHALPLLGTVSAAPPLAPARSSKVQPISTRRHSLLRWAAPAGALAAGLLIWIVAHENRMTSSHETPPIQVATKAPSSAVTPSAAASPLAREEMKDDEIAPRLPAPASPPKVQKEKDLYAKSLPSANLPIQGRNRQDLELLQQKGSALGGAAASNQNNPVLDSAAGVRGLPKSESNQSGGMQQNSGVQSQSNKEQIAAESAPLPAPPPSQNQAQVSSAKPSQNADAITAEVQNQVVVTTEARSFSDKPALKKVSRGVARDTRLAAAPGGNVLWHVGLGGRIEKSLDSGKTFARQNSGVKTELVAAAAPSDLVCWVVGRSGTILRTIDGGEHWTRFESPLTTNLGGVHAEDADHATIWDVAKNSTFATSDGGATWTRVPNE